MAQILVIKSKLNLLKHVRVAHKMIKTKRSKIVKMSKINKTDKKMRLWMISRTGPLYMYQHF